jgi:endonuclease III
MSAVIAGEPSPKFICIIQLPGMGENVSSVIRVAVMACPGVAVDGADMVAADTDFE